MAVNCGHVYFLPLAVAKKEKLVVPAYIEADGRVRYFVINTNRTDFQIANPQIATHVLPLPQKGHENFLTHNSWLCCDEVVGGLTAAEVEATKGCYRGPLDQPIVDAVKTLIKDSRLYSEADKAKIFKQWP